VPVQVERPQRSQDERTTWRYGVASARIGGEEGNRPGAIPMPEYQREGLARAGGWAICGLDRCSAESVDTAAARTSVSGKENSAAAPACRADLAGVWPECVTCTRAAVRVAGSAAARCRPADELATGGPKSLISALTGSSASAYAVAVLPVAANRPNSHSSSSGLCGAGNCRPTPAATAPADPGTPHGSRRASPNRLPDMTAQPRQGPTGRAQRRPLPPSPATFCPQMIKAWPP
jgi:hypothetical protein